MNYHGPFMESIIRTQNIKKKYSDLIAVNDVSFSIGMGKCFGLLGPNGAGKTTLIEIMEDIIHPTSGEVFYKGEPRSPSFREEVGIMFQETSLLGYMTVSETLKTFKSLYQDTSELETLVKSCHLEDIKGNMNDKVSGGQRQRLLLALALVNNPQLLFLDEPSTGLDPQARRNLWDIVKNVKKDGKTIVMTTHYMEEAQHLCDEVAIMDKGKIIARGSPEELIEKHTRGVTITLPRDNLNKNLVGLKVDSTGGDDLVKIRTENINSCLEDLVKRGLDLSHMTVRSPNLENVFLNLTGRRLRD